MLVQTSAPGHLYPGHWSIISDETLYAITQAA